MHCALSAANCKCCYTLHAVVSCHTNLPSTSPHSPLQLRLEVVLGTPLMRRRLSLAIPKGANKVIILAHCSDCGSVLRVRRYQRRQQQQHERGGGRGGGELLPLRAGGLLIEMLVQPAPK